jgi:hypothetical protein
VKGPTPRRLQKYARTCLRLGDYLDTPGDGRLLPRIPARCLLWALLILKILRTASLHGTEMVVRYATTSLGVGAVFGDDALAYFLERLSPDPTRRALADVLRHAKRNKVFAHIIRIGIALDGTGAGRTARQRCAFCLPYQKAKRESSGHGHHFVLASVVGAGIVLPFDAEPIAPGENELTAAKRLLERGVQGLGRRFADYIVLDSLYAGAPFVSLAQELGLDVIVGLKANMPDLLRSAHARFDGQQPMDTFDDHGQRVELWDANDVEASHTLPWPCVRVLRYRVYRKDGRVIEAYCYTTFSRRAVGSRALFHMRKSRWEIENQGFNDAKNRYGLEHIPHHEPNSILLHVLLTCLALCVERLYRLRNLHRGSHAPPSAVELCRLLWLHVSVTGYGDTS